MRRTPHSDVTPRNGKIASAGTWSERAMANAQEANRQRTRSQSPARGFGTRFDPEGSGKPSVTLGNTIFFGQGHAKNIFAHARTRNAAIWLSPKLPAVVAESETRPEFRTLCPRGGGRSQAALAIKGAPTAVPIPVDSNQASYSWRRWGLRDRQNGTPMPAYAVAPLPPNTLSSIEAGFAPPVRDSARFRC